MAAWHAVRPVPILVLLACAPGGRGTGPDGPAPVPAPAAMAAAPARPAADPGRPTDSVTPLPLPPPPHRDGPLAIAVVYPGPHDVVDVADSSFLVGSTGHGGAVLTVNGAPVPVAANGAFLAWVAYPDTGPARFTLVARVGRDSVVHELRVRRRPRFRPPAGPGPWIDTTSFAPAGRVWWPAGESLPLSVRAAPGSAVALVLPDGRRVPLHPDGRPDPVPETVRAFERDTLRLRRPRTADRFHGAVRGMRAGAPLPGVLDPDTLPARRAARGRSLLVEATLDGRTVRAAWPLDLALLDSMPPAARLDDARPGRPGADGITVGRARPGATYHWFFPAGTLARVTGRVNSEVRLGLSAAAEAWVAVDEAAAAPGALVTGPATVGSVTITPAPDRQVVRIPVTRQVPVRVDESERVVRATLYGTVGDVNWLRYGAVDPRLRVAAWRQAARDEVELAFELAHPVWGYRLRWDGPDLVLELRHPPAIDGDEPLRDLLVVVDPGHPPAGSTGPTGLTEAEANLAVSRRLRDLLEDAGARVLLTRDTGRPLDLAARVRLADSVDADLLVSIHNNALPDGIDPHRNAGSSVFFFHGRSLPLARAIQEGLARELAVPVLGPAFGDLAMVRPSWMPSALVEGLFMIVPEHEAALRSPEGQGRYARAVLHGLRGFLADFRSRMRR